MEQIYKVLKSEDLDQLTQLNNTRYGGQTKAPPQASMG